FITKRVIPMMMVKPLTKGTLHITDEVIAIITEAAVNETPGVSGTISGIKDEFARVVTKNPARGITVSTESDETIIDAKVSVTFGVNVGDVCFQIQEKVKRDVEMMAGVEVSAVNIFVEQIDFAD
ncbi:MAG TPA: Asp23/Gls24 family envelope stress response protein, partial [Bacillales bacterium]|nr:Asp23/Gls24 family envelope stress response protein [Bacillales bacterium]